MDGVSVLVVMDGVSVFCLREVILTFFLLALTWLCVAIRIVLAYSLKLMEGRQHDGYR
jgi:hypothetical protein